MSLSGTNINFHMLVGRYSSSGQWERVLETAREWLGTEPENADAHMAAGQALICVDREGEAEPHIQAVLAKQPQNDIAHRLLAAIHLEAGRFPAAIHATHAAIGINPRNAFHWYQLARIHYRAGNQPMALQCGLKARELNPTDANILNLIALCQPDTDANSGAKIRQYEQALAFDPENAAIHNNLGVQYLRQRAWQKAEESFRHALFLEPKDKLFRTNLFTTLKHRDVVYRCLRAPKDFLFEIIRFSHELRGKSIILYLVALPIWLLAFRFVMLGLVLWATMVWPLLKVYEYLTIGDLMASAGELGARRGGFLNYRRWPVHVRLGIFGLFLCSFWGGIALLGWKGDKFTASEEIKAVLGLGIALALLGALGFLLWKGIRDSSRRRLAQRTQKTVGPLMASQQTKQPWWKSRRGNAS